MKKITKQNNNEKKLNSFIVAGIIALIVAILCYMVLLICEDRVINKYDRTTVYLAKTDIAKGTQVSEKDFKQKSIDTQIVPTDAIDDISQISGTYVVNDIAKNSVVYAKQFEKVADAIDGTREVGVDTANLSASVNGVLRTSDFVDIYVFTDEEAQAVSGATMDQTEVVSNIVSEKSPTYSRVYVNSVFDDSGNIIKNDDDSSIAERFNIILDEDKADVLVSALQTGTVYITICRD